MTQSIEELDQGIALVDTGFVRPGFDASYIVSREGRAAFVETGTAHCVGRLLDALAQCQLRPGDVEYVIITHVHLDHSAGAGWLMKSLPNARLVTHPRGARHMKDPSKLLAGAAAVYGDEYVHQSYGEVIPVAENRVVEAPDGFEISVGGRRLHCVHTEGHAKHHLCVFDEQSRSFFTGDAFGLAYPELRTEDGPFVFPTTTPVQFDPAAMHDSIDLLMARRPKRMLLTHFGVLEDPGAAALELHSLIDELVALAQRSAGEVDRHERLVAEVRQALVGRLRARGCGLDEARLRELLDMDVELNAQGLGVWIDRQAH